MIKSAPNVFNGNVVQRKMIFKGGVVRKCLSSGSMRKKISETGRIVGRLWWSWGWSHRKC